MNKTIQEAEATIEELLEQRRQYEEWLNKLDASGDKAPPAVRQRVRGDYEARLQAVMEQLRGRGAAISEELERHHASQAELDRAAASGRRGAGRGGSPSLGGRVLGGRVAPRQRRQPPRDRAAAESPAQHRSGDHPPHRDSGRHQCAAERRIQCPAPVSATAARAASRSGRAGSRGKQHR